MHWLFLTAAILCEVAATALLKASAGFTKPWPTVGMIAGYAVSFFLLSLVLRSLNVGTTYAIWSAAGTVLIAVIGVLAFSERLTALQLIGIAVTIAGVVLINMGEAPISSPSPTTQDTSVHL